MNKGCISLLLLVVLLFSLVGCSKKLGEKEYFDMAYQQMGKEQWSEAEKYFQKILDEYPDGMYSSKALFMVGFVNANYLKNFEKARKYYTEFLKKYPNHDLADDAKYELENLGKDINEFPFPMNESVGEDSVVAEIPQTGVIVR
jgi:outer membrane protein assembly factor BamD (BamD/ComL family)